MAQEMPLPGYALAELVQGLVDLGESAAQCRVTGLTLDSRTVMPGDLFIALGGLHAHGADYLAQALERGASAVLLDVRNAPAYMPLSGRVPIVRVQGLSRLVGVLAARFFGDPSSAMTLYAVTGTNGKTSVSQFIAQALSLDRPCGLSGTLGSGLYGDLHATGHTTPDAITLQAELAEQYALGAKSAVLEVSSHALDQKRVAGVHFDVAVFTNLSHEHLDYHGDMAAYARAKRRLFTQPGLQAAVFNLDDAYGAQWHDEVCGELRCIGYGFGARAQAEQGLTLCGSDLQLGAAGLSFQVSSPWGEARLETALLGKFNAANLLAALGALLAAGIPFESAVERLGQVQTVPGRMERLGGGQQPTVVIDYAHTPDALQQVLQALRGHCRGILWCVFGCGGERDRGKRPLMGQLAESLADRVMLTNDNPRSEDPEGIIKDILRGVKDAHSVQVVRDRAAAIARAIQGAAADDWVLIAGKGHETEQIIGAQRLPFSDHEVAARCLQERVYA